MAKLSAKLFFLIACLSTALAASGCQRRRETGTLKVASAGAGSYDIYRIATEAPLQFVSELAGSFNEDIELTPGSYLVLADCSSESVIIYPGEKVELVAHRLEFIPPNQPTAADSFSIQCDRSERTKSRQSLVNKYELHVLSGRRDVLVGMVPLPIDLSKPEVNQTPQAFQYRLAALQVGVTGDNSTRAASYFVSPVHEIIAATKYQAFGQWEYLLPGRYALEINGTKMEVDIKAGEQRTIRPASLRVETSPNVDLSQAMRIKGSPWLVEINGGHWLNFNETYPLLPGLAQISVSGSTKGIEISLDEGTEVTLAARSITVDGGCTPGDLRCPGSRAVSLYSPNEPYPFIESVSDIPILVIDSGDSVLVSVEGSRDVTFEVLPTVRDKVMKLGYVRVVPQPTFKAGLVSDLVRVDALALPAAGYTLDINLDHPSVLPFTPGTYQLTHYVGSTAVDGERRNISRNFNVLAGETITLEVPVYISEKKFQALRQAKPAEDLETVSDSSAISAFYERARRAYAF